MTILNGRGGVLLLAVLTLAACTSSPWQRTDSGYWIAREHAPPPSAWSSTCFGAGFAGPWWPGHWRAGGFGHFGSCWRSGYTGSPHWFLGYGNYWHARQSAHHRGGPSSASLQSGRLAEQSRGYAGGTPRYESLLPARGRDLGSGRGGGMAASRAPSASAARAVSSPRAGAIDRRQEE